MEDKRKRLLQFAKSFRLTDRTEEEEKACVLTVKRRLTALLL